MRRIRQLPVFLAIAALFIAGCDALSSDDPDSSGVVTLSGQVLNSLTGNPVSGAFVRVLPYDLLYEADENGDYSFTVSIDSTMDLQVTAGADGYASASVTVLALASRSINVPTLRIGQLLGDEPVSGRAHGILLLSQSATSIGVRESGSEEVASLTFQVVDSVGRPVVLGNSTLLNFSFGAQPGGGADLAPASAATDNNGIATVTLSSGTNAGVTQVIAQTTVDGRTIRSQPVAVSIHGGLPDQSHFSVGPAAFNFPGLNVYGLENAISVIVGDQYANPVRPGTSVYFTASHAVIEGSIQTDDQGRGTVNLISANPLPGDGIGLITATSADVDQALVSGQTGVIFSGVPWVTVSPATVAVNTTYSLTVTDQNGNPLAGGTSITVQVEGTAVKGVGNTSVQLGDYGFAGGFTYSDVVRGPGVTEFVFRAAEDVDPNATDPETPVVDVITIDISGPNGRLQIVLGGFSGKSDPVTVSEGATVWPAADGVQVRAEEARR